VYVKQTHGLSNIDDIQPHPRNPRQGDVGALHESVEANGFYGTVIVQKATGFIVAGNHRWLVAKQRGADKIPVTWVDVDDDTALRILLVDNRTNDLASYDTPALAAILEQLLEGTGTLVGTGYDGDALDDLLMTIRGPDFGALDDMSKDADKKYKEGEVIKVRVSTITAVVEVSAAIHELLSGNPEWGAEVL
jgi:hypothetical protein